MASFSTPSKRQRSFSVVHQTIDEENTPPGAGPGPAPPASPRKPPRAKGHQRSPTAPVYATPTYEPLGGYTFPRAVGSAVVSTGTPASVEISSASGALKELTDEEQNRNLTVLGPITIPDFDSESSTADRPKTSPAAIGLALTTNSQTKLDSQKSGDRGEKFSAAPASKFLVGASTPSAGSSSKVHKAMSLDDAVAVVPQKPKLCAFNDGKALMMGSSSFAYQSQAELNNAIQRMAKEAGASTTEEIITWVVNKVQDLDKESEMIRSWLFETSTKMGERGEQLPAAVTNYFGEGFNRTDFKVTDDATIVGTPSKKARKPEEPEPAKPVRTYILRDPPAAGGSSNPGGNFRVGMSSARGAKGASNEAGKAGSSVGCVAGCSKMFGSVTEKVKSVFLRKKQPQPPKFVISGPLHNAPPAHMKTVDIQRDPSVGHELDYITASQAANLPSETDASHPKLQMNAGPMLSANVDYGAPVYEDGTMTKGKPPKLAPAILPHAPKPLQSTSGNQIPTVRHEPQQEQQVARDSSSSSDSSFSLDSSSSEEGQGAPESQI